MSSPTLELTARLRAAIDQAPPVIGAVMWLYAAGLTPREIISLAADDIIDGGRHILCTSGVRTLSPPVAEAVASSLRRAAGSSYRFLPTGIDDWWLSVCQGVRIDDEDFPERLFMLWRTGEVHSVDGWRPIANECRCWMQYQRAGTRITDLRLVSASMSAARCPRAPGPSGPGQ